MCQTRGKLAFQAAREMLDQLRRLSVEESVWDEWIAGHRQPSPQPPVIAGVRLNNTSRVADGIILSQLKLEIGQLREQLGTDHAPAQPTEREWDPARDGYRQGGGGRVFDISE